MGFSQVENLCSPPIFPDYIESGAEVEVVGVAENDFGINDINQFIGGECFHHSLCADGHENRRGDVTMSCGKRPVRAALSLASMLKLKRQNLVRGRSGVQSSIRKPSGLSLW